MCQTSMSDEQQRDDRDRGQASQRLQTGRAPPGNVPMNAAAQAGASTSARAANTSISPQSPLVADEDEVGVHVAEGPRSKFAQLG